jgi:hypothetical protein
MNEMYTDKVSSSYQDYIFPANPQHGTKDLPDEINRLVPVKVPIEFRSNNHYLWPVKEYSIRGVMGAVTSAIALSGVSALASEPRTAFLQLSDLIITLGNVAHLTQYWLRIVTVLIHPETNPYDKPFSPQYTVLNCTNYIAFLETVSADVPPSPHNFMYPDSPVYIMMCTPRQFNTINDLTRLGFDYSTTYQNSFCCIGCIFYMQ